MYCIMHGNGRIFLLSTLSAWSYYAIAALLNTKYHKVRTYGVTEQLFEGTRSLPDKI